MEGNPPGLHPALPIRSNLSLRAHERSAAARSPKARKVLGDGAGGTARSSPSAGTADRIRPGAHASPIVGARPLFPANERKAGEYGGSNASKSPDGSKWSPSADGGAGAGGREGRQFTVANVGSNGQIYLRPAIRPDPQRYPQQPVAFPVTPPSTAGLDALTPHKTRHTGAGDPNGSQWTPTPVTDPPSPTAIPKSAYFDLRPPATRHRRAVSDSTVHDVTPGAEASDAGVFKVMISKPQTEPKSQTTEDFDARNGPFLQVSIPSWKLGTPRFTLRGTPLIRGSSYAPTEDMRSSHSSFPKPSHKERINNLSQSDAFSSRIASLRSSKSQYPSTAWPIPGGDSPSPMAKPTGPAFMPTNLAIEPSMFDALTFKPACSDRSIVRYSPTTGAVIAATPPRLVAEITSPSFLDYDLISDFFLTFRSFLSSEDLLRLLIARLRWALCQADESGMIVKVRTFVAIRHWILNYFVDDFVADYQLRVTFCTLLNDFTDEIPTSQPKQKVPSKIVGELKKCWRRVCLQYWDGPEFGGELGPGAVITPGGIAGHRDPCLTPSFWETDSSEAPQIEGASIQRVDPQPRSGSVGDEPLISQASSSVRNKMRPSTPEMGNVPLSQQPTSPMSIASLDVVSCSFPTKALRLGDPNMSMPLGAHPVDPSSIYTATDPTAPTPALMAKRMRPQTSHRRNNSLTDSLREHGTITGKVLYKNAEFLLTLPYAGSLVRGNLLPPSQPFVDVDSVAGIGPSRQTTVFQPQPTAGTKRKASASAMSGPGMRKLLGSVRRALSTRGIGMSHTQGSYIDLAPIGPRGATTNRLPGSAVVPQARYSPHDMKQPSRIDLLGARIAEDFNQAVREDTTESKSASTTNGSHPGNIAENIEYSAAHMDSSFDLRPRSDAAITTGSKSIVIVDGTAPPEQLAMTGALAPFHPSVPAFADGITRIRGRNLTPPMTPPNDTFHGYTPSKSSYILGQQVYEPSPVTDPVPALEMTRMFAEGKSDEAVASGSNDKTTAKPSVSFIGQPSDDPPSTSFNRHKRQQSSRSYRSRGSVTQRRWASFQSGLAAQSTIKSFDATTLSEGSMKSEIMPPPLRMLRRKPGGDLRGAAHTTELDPLPLRRSQSIGSLTVYSESLRSSYLRSTIQEPDRAGDVVGNEGSQNRGEVFSLGALAEQAPKRPLSLFSTHSSKPVMRPSFETEAQKLAQIPDDIDDDGGVESALLKLEGKYERKTAKLSMGALKTPINNLQNLNGESSQPVGFPQAMDEKKKHRHLRIGDEDVPDVSPLGDESVGDNMVRSHIPHPSEISSFLSEDSLETYNSIPLLDRGLTDEGRSRTHTFEWTNHSILVGPDTPEDEVGNSVSSPPPGPSFEFIDETGGLVGLDLAVNKSEDRSFLNVDSDNESDLSSELSDMIDEGSYMPRPLSPNRIEVPNIPSLTHHPISEMHSYLDDDGSSIKLTLVQALQMSPETENIPELHEQQLWSQKPLPPTPDITPVAALYHQAIGSPSGSLGSPRAPSKAKKLLDEQTEQPPVHLPFILAFDSEILAQQFTLIEKDALNEVDWKELIEMKWKDSQSDSRSWVDFLRNTDARGVEVVIARFNIMVKWAISEIVLTQAVEERARCIIKLLHIASRCREYRNFATMSQIAIALTSIEVTRLSKTWAMVPPPDMKIMSDLETLVSPTKNFYNLRAEMEGGGNTADAGCIPFIGIYTHDLLFNAQRPSEIASSPTNPPLVNFERCRITASIVKTLLRLLETSTFYKFQPIEGITERCLWMGALSDQDIRKKSESLEENPSTNLPKTPKF
ncbi:hypothetical protein F4777DRAFT_436578 [Nemania sp. FL0916]|nr:hypothetical protein F4777DRAFT_436578 [Nemania sp. FL0916]